MSQKIIFKDNKIDDFTIVLSNRSHQHLGQLTGIQNVKFIGNLNSAQEISFTVYRNHLIPEESGTGISQKDIENYQNYIWNSLIDFKLIWVKELDEYFEIRVTVDDAKDTIKSINGKSLCESELSQTYLYNVEINSESDISRTDYDENFPTVFYRNPENLAKYDDIWVQSENYNVYKTDASGEFILDANNEKTIDEAATYTRRYSILKSSSLMHRIMDKIPHYTLRHIDESLCELQRTFSVDGTSIYDFLIGECSEQFNCLFQFDSANRAISVYDMETFGKDTPIYVDKHNLTDSIHLEMDGDSVKNCFKLEGGDELMTATIRSLNPNGSDYLYVIRENDRDDMPTELTERLENYEASYESFAEECQSLTEQEYDLLDKKIYYKSGMMPKIERVTDMPTLSTIADPREGILYVYNDVVYLFDGDSEFEAQSDNSEFFTNLISSFVSAKEEAKKLTDEKLSPIALRSVTEYTSCETVNSAIENYAKVLLKTGYTKLEIIKSSFNVEIDANSTDDNKVIKDQDGNHYGTWTGIFKITNYSDTTDVAYSDELTITVNDNYQEFMSQKIAKDIKSNDNDGYIFDVLSIDNLDDFKNALKLYSLNRLKSFYDAIDGARDVLIQQDQAKDGAELYDLYLSYNERINLLLPDVRENAEIKGECDIRQEKVNMLQLELDEISKRRAEIQDELNFEKYLDDLYPIFCAYKREDKFSNANYISDGLDNAKLIKRANEFWNLAKKELLKSSIGKCTISSSLYNLLAMKEFEPIVDHFELGNRIRVKVDGELYTLQLIGYEIDFNNLQTINVTFSTATKVFNSKTETESILHAAQSMATSYSHVSKQAEKGQEANDNVNSVLQNGLNSGLVQIKNNDNEEVTYGKHGILCRSYDDISNSFDKEQVKITHNTIAFTDNNWESVRQAIGKYHYDYYDEATNLWKREDGYGMVGDAITAGQVSGATIVGGKIYSNDYSDGTNGREKNGTFIDLKEGTFSFAAGGLTYDGHEFTISDTAIGKSLEGIEIKAENLQINADNVKGTLKNSINVNNAFVVDSDGKIMKITLPSTTTLPWGQITGTPLILSQADVSTIISNTVTADYVNVLDIVAKNVVEGITIENAKSINAEELYITTPYIFSAADKEYKVGLTDEWTIGEYTLSIVGGIIVDIKQNQNNKETES